MSLPEVQDTGNLMNGFQGYDQSYEDFMSTCVRCRKSTDAATKIGFGGFAYVARVLGMSRRTIYTGIGELEAMGNEDHPPQRLRGGAKRIRRPSEGRPGGAEPTVRAASAGGPLPAVHLQVASDRAPFVLSFCDTAYFGGIEISI